MATWMNFSMTQLTKVKQSSLMASVVKRVTSFQMMRSLTSTGLGRSLHLVVVVAGASKTQLLQMLPTFLILSRARLSAQPCSGKVSPTKSILST